MITCLQRLYLCADANGAFAQCPAPGPLPWRDVAEAARKEMARGSDSFALRLWHGVCRARPCRATRLLSSVPPILSSRVRAGGACAAVVIARRGAADHGARPPLPRALRGNRHLPQ